MTKLEFKSGNPAAVHDPNVLPQFGASLPANRWPQDTTVAPDVPRNKTGVPLALGYLLVLLAAEVLTQRSTAVALYLGPLAHGVVLLLLVLHGILSWERQERYVPLILTLSPLARLLLMLSGPATMFTAFWCIALPSLAAFGFLFREHIFPGNLRAYLGRYLASQHAFLTSMWCRVASLQGAFAAQYRRLASPKPHLVTLRHQWVAWGRRIRPLWQRITPGEATRVALRRYLLDFRRRLHPALPLSLAFQVAIVLLAILAGLSVAYGNGSQIAAMPWEYEQATPHSGWASELQSLLGALLERGLPDPSASSSAGMAAPDPGQNQPADLVEPEMDATPEDLTPQTIKAVLDQVTAANQAKGTSPIDFNDIDEVRGHIVAEARREALTAAEPPAPPTPPAPATVDWSYCPGVSLDNIYPRGVCTWYAKARRPDLPWFSGEYGLAVNWPYAAEQCGFRVNQTPAAGAVIVFPAGANGASPGGHVGYVEQVGPDYLLISECNVSHDSAFVEPPLWWEAGYSCAYRRIPFTRLSPSVIYIHGKKDYSAPSEEDTLHQIH